MVADRMAARREGTHQILDIDAAANTKLKALVKMAKHRWIIERDYEELKQELGLGHFEGRNWRGFHHHATLCIAAYGFLVAERNRFSPSARAGHLGFVAPGPAPDFRPRGSPRHAPSGIIRTRSRRCASSWRACYCGNCLTAPFADRARDDPPRRYRLRPRRRQAANDSGLCAKRLRVTLLC